MKHNMKLFAFLFLLVLAALCAMPSEAQAQDSRPTKDEIVRRIEAKYASLRTATEFPENEYVLEYLGESDLGELYYAVSFFYSETHPEPNVQDLVVGELVHGEVVTGTMGAGWTPAFCGCFVSDLLPQAMVQLHINTQLPVGVDEQMAIMDWKSAWGTWLYQEPFYPLQPVQAPVGFCDNEPWQINLNIQIPLDPNCGEGKYWVVVNGVRSNEIASFNEAIEYLRNLGGIGTLWFEAKPALQPVQAPVGFCDNEPWQINLNIQIPLDPNCGEGKYWVVVNGVRSNEIASFNEAIEYLRNLGGIGTLWFMSSDGGPVALPEVP